MNSQKNVELYSLLDIDVDWLDNDEEEAGCGDPDCRHDSGCDDCDEELEE